MAKTTAKTTKTTKTTARKTTTKAAAPRTVAASAPRELVIPEEYRPIGMWGYFAYQFLFAIPLIGWILCICFAFVAQNRNLRNFARSQFCWLVIYVIIFCVLAGLGALKTVVEAFGII